MRPRGIEPRAQDWKSYMLPLHQGRCSIRQAWFEQATNRTTADRSTNWAIAGFMIFYSRSLFNPLCSATLYSSLLIRASLCPYSTLLCSSLLFSTPTLLLLYSYSYSSPYPLYSSPLLPARSSSLLWYLAVHCTCTKYLLLSYCVQQLIRLVWLGCSDFLSVVKPLSIRPRCPPLLKALFWDNKAAHSSSSDRSSLPLYDIHVIEYFAVS